LHPDQKSIEMSSIIDIGIDCSIPTSIHDLYFLWNRLEVETDLVEIAGLLNSIEAIVRRDYGIARNLCTNINIRKFIELLQLPSELIQYWTLEIINFIALFGSKYNCGVIAKAIANDELLNEVGKVGRSEGKRRAILSSSTSGIVYHLLKIKCIDWKNKGIEAKFVGCHVNLLKFEETSNDQKRAGIDLLNLFVHSKIL